MELKLNEVEEMKRAFVSSPKNLIAMNAVSNNSLTSVALSRVFFSKYNHVFSNEVKTMKITNQKHSGRCWMFAGLNFLRNTAAKKLNIDQFELSQSYEMFWDKLEKANYFLESIIETVKEGLHSRLVSWLLEGLIEDGGQWGMFSKLVKKYGVVPKEVMKESFHTSNSQAMNMLLKTKLREDAMILRKMSESGESESSLREKKHELMKEIYRMLTISIGLPTEKFDYEYKDKEGFFHRISDITPIEFYEKYVGVDLDDMVSVINCPTSDKDFHKTYTVQYLGNVVGGENVVYLNENLDALKNMAKKAIENGDIIWFASDVGKMMEKDSGILDTEVYDFENLYDVNFNLDKAQRLDYGNSLMTHAMVLTGVDIVNDKSVKWKVENSWGEKVGKEGYFVMGDRWFDEYVYEIVISKKYLSSEMKEALKKKPTILPPWDPMGSVAKVK